MKLNKNDVNTACFRLSSKSILTADTVYHLFSFTNSSTRQEILFTGQDISNNKPLFNEYTIIETGSTYTNLTASTICLAPAGWWSYRVYEMTDQNNLKLSATTGIAIEYGKVEVIELTATTAGSRYKYESQSDEERFVYRPNQ